MKKIPVYEALNIEDISNNLLISSKGYKHAFFKIEKGMEPYKNPRGPFLSPRITDRDIPDGAVMGFSEICGSENPVLKNICSEHPSKIIRRRAHFLSEEVKVRNLSRVFFFSYGRRKLREIVFGTENNSFESSAAKEYLCTVSREYERMKTCDMESFLAQCLVPGGEKIPENFGTLSPRERILNESFVYNYNKNIFICGNLKMATLSLFDIASEETALYDMETVLRDFRMPFSYLYTVSFELLWQEKVKKTLTMLRNIFGTKDRYSELGDTAAEHKFRQAGELIGKISSEGVKLGKLSARLLLYHEDENRLEKMLELTKQLLRKKGYLFYRDYVPDREIFSGVLPGQSEFTPESRKITVLSDNFAAMIPVGPVSNTFEGEEFPLMLRDSSGSVFPVDIMAETRGYNNNGILLGPSGSGKSFFTSMLLSHSVIPRIISEKGRLLILDFAGEEKSSYMKLLNVYEEISSFVSLGPESDFFINPFPPRCRAFSGSTPSPRVMSFLSVLCDILFLTTESTRDAELIRGIYRKALIETYSFSETPDFSTLLKALKKIEIPPEREKDREVLIQLLSQFLESSEASALLPGNRKALNPNSPVVLFDLHGLSGFSEKMSQLLLCIVLEMVADTAFRSRGPSCIVQDELARQIKNKAIAQRMIEKTEELSSTARKYNTAQLLITQDFRDISESEIKTVITNISYLFLLDHGNRGELKKQIASELDFSELEKEMFFSLRRSSKREARQVFIKTANADGEISRVADIHASDYEYWINTTNDKDNEYLKNVMRKHSCGWKEACEKAVKYSD